MSETDEYPARTVLLTGRTDIAPSDLFEFAGVQWRAITGSVGYRSIVSIGGIVVEVPAGMVNDADYPDGAVLAERIWDGH